MNKTIESYWKELKNFNHKKEVCPSFYDIVYLIYQEDGSVFNLQLNSKLKIPVIFTDTSKIGNMFDPQINYIPSNLKYRPIMVGELIELFEKEKFPTPIIINPYKKGPDVYEFDNTLFLPIKDPHTKKLLLTDPEEARALYAINPVDQKRFGIEFVFYIQTQTDLPTDGLERSSVLKEKIEFLSYLVPRTPVRRGSSSFFVIILDLENDMEETAFIRPYKTMDSYTNLIFLDSHYNLKTGELENIPYLSQTVDELFNGLIKWDHIKRSSIHLDSRI
jgi:hypothetical protein